MQRFHLPQLPNQKWMVLRFVCWPYRCPEGPWIHSGPMDLGGCWGCSYWRLSCHWWCLLLLEVGVTSVDHRLGVRENVGDSWCGQAGIGWTRQKIYSWGNLMVVVSWQMHCFWPFDFLVQYHWAKLGRSVVTWMLGRMEPCQLMCMGIWRVGKLIPMVLSWQSRMWPYCIQNSDGLIESGNLENPKVWWESVEWNVVNFGGVMWTGADLILCE